MSSIESGRSDYFALLSLPESVEPDLAALDQAYQKLQSRWHPDKFAGLDAATRLEAVQNTSLLNDAYTTLKNPLSRAAYLLQRRGLEPYQHVQSQLQPGFLLEQMQLREALEDCTRAADEAGLARLGDLAAESFGRYWADFCSQLEALELESAKAVFHKLQFIAKLQDEIYEEETRLFD